MDEVIWVCVNCGKECEGEAFSYKKAQFDLDPICEDCFDTMRRLSGEPDGSIPPRVSLPPTLAEPKSSPKSDAEDSE